MMPLNLSFRKLILRNIPELKADDLDRYESLLALRTELIHDLSEAGNSVVFPNGDPENGDESIPGEAGEKGTPLRKKRVLPGGAQVRRQETVPIIEQIKNITQQVYNRLSPFRERLAALHAIWISRRQLALSEGNLLQIPNTKEGFKNLFGAIYDYRIRQLPNFGIVLKGRFRKRTPEECDEIDSESKK